MSISRILCLLLLLVICTGTSSVAGYDGVVNFPISGITVSPGDPDFVFDEEDDVPIVRVTGFDFSKPSLVSLFLDVFNIHDPPVWAAEGIALAIVVITGGFAVFLFSRRKLSSDPESRPMQILAFITEHHGCRQSDIIRATGFSRGSVSYNLKLLRREGKINREEIKTSETKTPETKTPETYYPAGAPKARKDPGLELLSREKPQKIFACIAENPGISQKQIGEVIGYPTTTLRWHLSRLETQQVIFMEKDRNLTQYTVSSEYLELYKSHFSDYHAPDITKK